MPTRGPPKGDVKGGAQPQASEAFWLCPEGAAGRLQRCEVARAPSDTHHFPGQRPKETKEGDQNTQDPDLEERPEPEEPRRGPRAQLSPELKSQGGSRKSSEGPIDMAEP
ncbi:hypothetical protein H8959_009959 [Pygathrix nigripes]